MKDDVFVTVVFKFKILGATSNLVVTAFQTRPSPANCGYSPAEFSIASSTYSSVARSAVFAIPWTFMVAALCAVIAVFLFVVSTAIAAFLFTTSAASASTRF